MVKDLIEIKFYKVGEWILENESLKVSCKELPTNQNALYSFILENEVVYVGKTTNTLRKRLGQYEKPHCSQKTNMKVHIEIRDLLKKNRNVEIYVYVDYEPQTIGRFILNKPAGLEDSIIQKLNPKWNNMGRNKGEEAITPLEETNEQRILSNYQTYKTLQKMGYSKTKICDELYLTKEELTDLEIQYHELTGN